MSSNIVGLRDWIIQRVTAIYLAIFIILTFAYLAAHPDLQFATWKHLFNVFWFQIAALIFLVCLSWHAWIGVWTIITDYVKVAVLKPLVQIVVILALIVFFIWGVEIIWGIPLTWMF